MKLLYTVICVLAFFLVSGQGLIPVSSNFPFHTQAGMTIENTPSFSQKGNNYGILNNQIHIFGNTIVEGNAMSSPFFFANQAQQQSDISKTTAHSKILDI